MKKCRFISANVAKLLQQKCAIKEQLWRLFIWEATLILKQQTTFAATFPIYQKKTFNSKAADCYCWFYPFSLPFKIFCPAWAFLLFEIPDNFVFYCKLLNNMYNVFLGLLLVELMWHFQESFCRHVFIHDELQIWMIHAISLVVVVATPLWYPAREKFCHVNVKHPAFNQIRIKFIYICWVRH